jgi:hypothetical protein
MRADEFGELGSTVDQPTPATPDFSTRKLQIPEFSWRCFGLAE